MRPQWSAVTLSTAAETNGSLEKHKSICARAQATGHTTTACANGATCDVLYKYTSGVQFCRLNMRAPRRNTKSYKNHGYLASNMRCHHVHHGHPMPCGAKATTPSILLTSSSTINLRPTTQCLSIIQYHKHRFRAVSSNTTEVQIRSLTVRGAFPDPWGFHLLASLNSRVLWLQRPSIHLGFRKVRSKSRR